VTTDPTPWFVPLVPASDRASRVLGFPQAGGGCATFTACAGHLGPGVALWGLNPPGRQARFAEPPIRDLGTLVADVTADLTRYTDRPYVLFGYCSGALSAFLVARAVAAAGLVPPRALVVAAQPAPQLTRPTADLHTLPADEFWARIVSFGGFSAVLAAQPDYRDIFEPSLRADYEALAGFRYEAGPRLDVPIIAVTGRHDGLLTQDEVAAWADQTAARFDVQLVAADHWLLDTVPDELARILEKACLL
jgi:medium-chain acyl-[acyl-carrier-protein] hydrolase